MTTFVEDDLEITFNNVITARKFDDEYRLSHCMKAVDFIVELHDRYLFIEFKDPQASPDPKASVKNYIEQFKSKKLDSDLKYKFRDSFLYEWATGNLEKPADYYVLVAVDTLDAGLLDRRSAELKRQIPTGIPANAPWIRSVARDCFVFNIESWNRNLPDYPVHRRSSVATT